MASEKMQSMEKIQQLRQMLWLASEALQGILPTSIREIVNPPPLRTKSDLKAWLHTVPERIVDHVESVATGPDGKDGGDLRLPCPLCQRGAQTVYVVGGFAIPEGLHRHLAGAHGAARCPVLQVISTCEEEQLEASASERQPLDWDIIREAQVRRASGRKNNKE